jgi:hypothetical protein
MKTSSERFIFDEPGRYRIRVHGYPDPRRSDVLGGMTISPRRSTTRPPTTTLTGELQDQAALMGVLDTLYNSSHAIIEVKRLPAPAAVA